MAELLALPVLDMDRLNRLNFPTTHALYGTGPEAKDADVLLMLEPLVPYIYAGRGAEGGQQNHLGR